MYFLLIVLLGSVVAKELPYRFPIESKSLYYHVEQQGAEDFDVRQKATEALQKSGRSVLIPLARVALQHPDLEVRTRTAQVIRSFLKPPAPLSRAEAYCLVAIGTKHVDQQLAAEKERATKIARFFQKQLNWKELKRFSHDSGEALDSGAFLAAVLAEDLPFHETISEWTGGKLKIEVHATPEGPQLFIRFPLHRKALMEAIPYLQGSGVDSRLVGNLPRTDIGLAGMIVMEKDYRPQLFSIRTKSGRYLIKIGGTSYHDVLESIQDWLSESDEKMVKKLCPEVTDT